MYLHYLGSVGFQDAVDYQGNIILRIAGAIDASDIDLSISHFSRIGNN